MFFAGFLHELGEVERWQWGVSCRVHSVGNHFGFFGVT